MLGDTWTDPEHLKKIDIFIKAVLRLIVVWIAKVPSMAKTIDEIDAVPLLFLVDPQAAIIEASTELMETLGKLFGTCMRGLRFFSFYDSNQEAPSDVNKFVDDEKLAVIANTFGVVV